MRRLAAVLAAALALAAGARAEAYCRSAACPARFDGSTDGHVCRPAQSDDCGIELQWRQPCIGFNVQESGSAQIDVATATATLEKAFAAWAAVDCGGGPPSITVFDLGTVTCSKVEYNKHAGNANILLFRDDEWPHETDNGLGSADTLALTTVTYDVEKGDIYDADIEVNTANNQFTTIDDPTPDEVDLLAVLTHETGHFLGLAHSGEPMTTMFPDYTRGTIDIRFLAPDDMDAICAAYPPDRVPDSDCTGVPRHGYAPECGDEQTYVSCAAGPAEGGAAMGWSLLALSAVIAAARRSTARRGSRGS